MILIRLCYNDSKKLINASLLEIGYLGQRQAGPEEMDPLDYGREKKRVRCKAKPG